LVMVFDDGREQINLPVVYPTRAGIIDGKIAPKVVLFVRCCKVAKNVLWRRCEGWCHDCVVHFLRALHVEMRTVSRRWSIILIK